MHWYRALGNYQHHFRDITRTWSRDWWNHGGAPLCRKPYCNSWFHIWSWSIYFFVHTIPGSLPKWVKLNSRYSSGHYLWLSRTFHSFVVDKLSFPDNRGKYKTSIDEFRTKRIRKFFQNGSHEGENLGRSLSRCRSVLFCSILLEFSILGYYLERI